MKVTYSWLKKYVDIKATPEELAEGLTLAGSEVESIEDAGKEKVLSFEITTNRPDCLNVIGLAREASAVFDEDLRLPEMTLPEAAEGGPAVGCTIKSKKLCSRYTARVITGVTVKSSSAAIKDPLIALGMRDVNNVVDVTNYCLMETGQPMHAFDLDKIKGGKIVVREAVKGEKIITIDGEERELDKGMLVIADSDRPIAVAGVMGGQNTEVTEGTKNILLESAYFDPLSVRRTARKLGLSSDSSYRFERGVDKGMVVPASDRAAMLIAKETGGSICGFLDEGEAAPSETEITFDITRAGEVLGVPLERDKVEKILTRLGLKILGEDGSALTVQVPSFREDLSRSIDLVEEVARIYGYDNIPARVNKLIPQIERKKRARLVLEKIRQLLVGAGLNEIMTYNLIGEAAVERFRALSAEPVELKNYLSEELRYLTPQLLHGMLKSISWNLNRKNRDLGLFEIGKTYSKGSGKRRYAECDTVCIALTGALRKNWVEGAREVNIFDLRGAMDLVLRRLHLEPVFEPRLVEGFSVAAIMKLWGSTQKIGFGGEISKKILKDYDIEHPVYLCQLNLDEVLESAVLENHYRPIPKFPFSSRDVSILCEETVIAGELYEAMAATGEDLVQDIELVDVYRGEKIPSAKVSYAYSIKYGLPTRTLTDEEVGLAHDKLKNTLQKKFDISFR
ncbi:MAG: phenylalanine--tRNA ligase subunit beta [Candidatus Tantalella remota]|nr:phenylalanine--tRNA ligase subunit beta [Candidatus Tantalella remota]